MLDRLSNVKFVSLPKESGMAPDHIDTQQVGHAHNYIKALKFIPRSDTSATSKPHINTQTHTRDSIPDSWLPLRPSHVKFVSPPKKSGMAPDRIDTQQVAHAHNYMKALKFIPRSDTSATSKPHSYTQTHTTDSIPDSWLLDR